MRSARLNTAWLFLMPKPIRGLRNVERKPEHDAIGLALLIFHLLFMGRHPFAGRFQGSRGRVNSSPEGRFLSHPYLLDTARLMLRRTIHVASDEPSNPDSGRSQRSLSSD